MEDEIIEETYWKTRHETERKITEKRVRNKRSMEQDHYVWRHKKNRYGTCG